MDFAELVEELKAGATGGQKFRRAYQSAGLTSLAEGAGDTRRQDGKERNLDVTGRLLKFLDYLLIGSMLACLCDASNVVQVSMTASPSLAVLHGCRPN